MKGGLLAIMGRKRKEAPVNSLVGIKLTTEEADFIRQLAEEKEWTMAHTARKFLRRGLSAYRKDNKLEDTDSPPLKSPRRVA